MSFHNLIFFTLCKKSLNDLSNSYFNLAAGIYFYIKVRRGKLSALQSSRLFINASFQRK